MDFRQYDNALGRFSSIDLLAENSLSMTPYHFGNNNPNYWADPSGLDTDPPKNVKPIELDEVVVKGKPRSSSSTFALNTIYLDGNLSGGSFGYGFGAPMFTPGTFTSISLGGGGGGFASSSAPIPTASLPTIRPVASTSPAQGNGGVDLGTVGNFIRSQAGSEFSQSLFTNYWQAGGNMTLSQSRFNSIVQAAGRVQSVSNVTLANGQSGIAKVHSFYGSSEYGKALGCGTIYYNQSGTPVGFNDTYNFNWRWSWGEGSRPYLAERQTRAVSIAGFFFGAQPFNITYGIGVRP